jgi:hypothetical protein
LIGTGVFCVSAVAALWFLGREKHPTLRAWRIVFVLWTLLLTPLLLTISDGIAEQGWPSGRMNRPIAHLLLLVLTLAIPSFLTGLGALIRTYRVAGVLAVVTGLISLVTSVFLFRATAPIKISPLRLVDILDIVGFCSKATTYLSIPVGIALIVGGIMTFQAARAGTVSATSSDHLRLTPRSATMDNTPIGIKAKKSIGYIYVGIPIVLVVLAIISLSASRGNVYIGPGGLAIVFAAIGIWFLRKDLITFEASFVRIKLAPLAKTHIIHYSSIVSLALVPGKKLTIDYGQGRAVVRFAAFDPAQSSLILNELQARSGKAIA